MCIFTLHFYIQLPFKNHEYLHLTEQLCTLIKFCNEKLWAFSAVCFVNCNAKSFCFIGLASPTEPVLYGIGICLRDKVPNESTLYKKFKDHHRNCQTTENMYKVSDVSSLQSHSVLWFCLIVTSKFNRVYLFFELALWS